METNTLWNVNIKQQGGEVVTVQVSPDVSFLLPLQLALKFYICVFL